MLLSYVFNQITQGEGSQLSLAGADVIGIQLSDYEKIIPHLNLAMIELYKRFSLKVDEITVQEYAAISTYILEDDYAVSNDASEQPIKYIVDTAEDPFTNNILRIESITDEEGTELGIDDYNDEDSVLTLTYDSIKLPNPADDGILTISYRAAPEIIIGDDDLNPETYDVRIPIFLLEALIFYIGSRLFASDAELSMLLLTKYEASCKRVTDLELVIPDNTTNLKLTDNGWV